MLSILVPRLIHIVGGPGLKHLHIADTSVHAARLTSFIRLLDADKMFCNGIDVGPNVVCAATGY